MSKPYDASLKDLLTRHPEDWVPFVSDRVPDRVEIVDTDLSKVSAATDKLIRVFDPDPWLLQLDLQSSYLHDLNSRTHWYNATIGYKEGLPVISLVVLLHRRADSPRWTGQYEQCGPRGDRYLEFRYRVIRAWELPLERVLTGGIGLVPLAVITDEAQSQLPAVVSRIGSRFTREADHSTAADLWAITATLAGLRVDKLLIRQLMGGIMELRESSFFEFAGEEMALKRLRETLLRVGRKTIGEPSEAALVRINAIRDVDALESLIVRAVDASDWISLLAAPEAVAS
jgi:predicted transposase YdaD